MAEADPVSAGPTAKAGPQAPPPVETGGEETLTPEDVPQAPSASAFPQVTGYEILAELGRGGMGVVYRARQLGLNRLVALKMILAGPFADAESKARFRAEAAAVAQLQHANIVQIFHIGEERGLIYFSLELVGKGNLQQKLAGAPQPASDAARLVEVLARAVGAAHRRGIIHRDLKPANILLGEDGTPKIADFGLAKQLGQQGLSSPGHVMGTPSYMAPEQASGSRELGPAVDVHALGAILYEMLTGQPPFCGPSAMETLDQVRFAPPVPPSQLCPQVPLELEKICLRCLRKDPRERFATALALADELRWFLQAHQPASPAVAEGVPTAKPAPVLPAGAAPLTFRVLPDETTPAAGELWIRAARGYGGAARKPVFERPPRPMNVARLVWEHGLEALECGPGPVSSIVINAAGTQPTFDEMLASLFAQYLLSARPQAGLAPQALLPASFGSLAKYAELLRQGKTPTKLSPEETLEGIFLGMRNLAGADLTDPDVAGRFLEGWRRLAERLASAREESVFQTSLFAGSEFAEVKAYLLEDERRYRRDVLQGEKWLIRLPQSTRTESGLFLKSPRSALFPYWSRRDAQAPASNPYLFLAVCWPEKNWVFSTDPAHDEVSLQELAQALQKEENAARGADAAEAPRWYDGRRHHFTLVAAPQSSKDGGTRLSDERVLGIVKKWSRARRANTISWRPLVWAACVILGLGLLLGLWHSLFGL